VQTGVGMSLAIPVEVKPCLSVSYNRSYQINEHYPCITPCFERWLCVQVITDPDCYSSGASFGNFKRKGIQITSELFRFQHPEDWIPRRTKQTL
jgi:hypothetical protein